jgi:hypothetical protein
VPKTVKQKYEPEGVISLGHIDNRAKRKVAKLFLSHLWFVWRQMEGASDRFAVRAAARPQGRSAPELAAEKRGSSAIVLRNAEPEERIKK